MTYAQALETAIALVDAETAEKLSALKAQIEKKHSSDKPTKKQMENEVIKEEIAGVLANVDAPIRIGDIVTALGDRYTPNKVSAMLRQMREADKVERTYEKKIAYFALK